MLSRLRASISKSPGGILVTELQGTKTPMPYNWGGLGYRFYDQLSGESEKILQVDTINNITETKRSIKTRSVRLALEMKGRGVGQNDIILISSKTHAHQTIVVIATLFVGGIVCPINPESSFKEQLALVKILKPKMCFCDSRTISQIDRIIMSLNITSEIVCFGGNVSGKTQFSTLFPFAEDINFQPFFVDHPSNEVAFILPTQGTSNDPKLVCLSHTNIYLQCMNFMEIFDKPIKVISFFPLSWLTQTVITCCGLEFGVTLIMAPTFNERLACKMIHDFVIDVAILGTELALRLTTNVAVKDFNLSCLKSVLVGVQTTTKDDIIYMRRVLPTVKFLPFFTLTETGFIASVIPQDYTQALTKPMSVGTLLRNCKAKIVNIETNEVVGPNNVGELYFHGDGVMLGYCKNNSATLAAIEKGYFKTGDLAQFDSDGWIYIEGRIEDIIYFEGTKFIPREIEACLVSHPHVSDACLIGNETMLVACVQKKVDSKLTAQSLLVYLSKKMDSLDKNITAVIFLEDFPRTSAGTIKKRLLREQFLKVKIEYTKSLASISPTTATTSTSL